MESDLRQKFEAWAAEDYPSWSFSRYPNTERVNPAWAGNYVDWHVQYSWLAYQAAYTAGLREAAGICACVCIYQAPWAAYRDANLARVDELEKGR